MRSGPLTAAPRSVPRSGAPPAVEVVAPAPPPGVACLQTLVDPGSFRAWRTAVGDGVVAGLAHVDGRRVCVWAQDATYRGGSLGVAGGETIAHTIRRASNAGVPLIGVPHSGGARLREGVGALTAYGAIFREQALARVPQITLIAGACAGGAAYSPALGDVVIMVGPDARLFLTGPRVVRQATGERVGSEALGGPRVHAANGVAQLAAGDERAAASLLRELLGYVPSRLGGAPPRAAPADASGRDPAAALPPDPRRVYDVREVIVALVDAGEHLELAGRWARNMVTTLARLDGRPVGVIANQPRHLGGTIDSVASEKGVWFVGLCERFGLPLIVLVDTPGFLPGAGQERAGVIRHGAALLRAFACARVPRLTVTLRRAFGGAHIVMNSRDLGADLTLAWPNAQIGIMGARQAVAIAERRAIAAGADVDELARRYAAEHLTAEVAAANGFVDEIVSPAETREHLLRTLELHA
jgi:acetyl-CoA carboxylase carboxyltransferase component